MDKSTTSWCDYSALLPPKQVVRRFDSKSARFYWWQEPEEGRLVTKTAIGITSLLSMVMAESKPLTDWKIRTEGWKELLDASSEYGTSMHGILTEWLINKSVPKEMLDAARIPVIRAKMAWDMPEKDLLSWALFCEQYNVEALLIEACLVSEPIDGDHFCQAIDLLLKLDVIETVIEVVNKGKFKSGPRKGQDNITEKKTKVAVRKTAVLDWKSNFASKDAKSFFESHKHQLIAAKRAVEYNYGDVKVDLLINWSPDGWRTQPNYTMKIWEITQKDYDMFDAYIRIAHISGFFKPSGHIFVAPEFTPETKSTDFRMLSYVEFVEQVLLADKEEELTVYDDEIDSPILSYLDGITE